METILHLDLSFENFLSIINQKNYKVTSYSILVVSKGVIYLQYSLNQVIGENAVSLHEIFNDNGELKSIDFCKEVYVQIKKDLESLIKNY